MEYERSVGKISETDYATLRTRYRTEAKRLLKRLDEDLEPMRAKAEAYAAEQLRRAVTLRTLSGRGDGCPDCNTVNDRDAIFCKKCGCKLTRDSRSANHATP